MNCPMCGELWDRDRCATCGWSERLDPVNRKRLDVITDLVLAYKPTARSGPAVQRKRRRTILLNKPKKRGK